MARHIKSNDVVTEVTPQNGKSFSLQELQGFVGGYIELVRLPGKQFMVVNEEGLLKDLPSNFGASLIAG